MTAGFDISSYSATSQVILKAMKKYGLMLADIGSNMYISGAPDERWNNDELRELLQVKASDFEVVNTSSLMVNPDSGQARAQSGAPTATAASTASAMASASATPGTPTLAAQDARKQDQNTRATTNWPLMLAVMALVGVGLIGGGIWLRARRRRIPSPFG